ncbi:hypothetical protein [Mucilaginibacter agri]|uniref:Uncharacterized protein n=1 Tax=Mucilaginibacter agri TaxID=2695265 RepID=A0A966DT87_9SPHI|nr:hypothetical protein [Mucilaginibacter agri]NCD69067.1 hypothetical protein [Mucilaginibacter agri]
MRSKVTLSFILALTFIACKKSDEVALVSSDSIQGNWKFLESSNVTIAGLFKHPADPSNPIIINFNESSYTETDAGKVAVTGTYALVNKYEYIPGYFADSVLTVNNEAKGKYKIHRGQPDTLVLNAIDHGPDYDWNARYLRVK